MPRRAPFTTLCGKLARLNRARKVDLHIHTTASDGAYTPSQVVGLARSAGMSAVAITDHDTCAGLAEARLSAGSQIQLIPGVEISAALEGREVHLLGYFVQPDDVTLNVRLAEVCASRRERFRDFVELLSREGIVLPENQVKGVESVSASPGRRHIAGLIVVHGAAKNLTDAFHRFLFPLQRRVRSKQLIAIAEAIELVRAAGGISSLAHPPENLLEEQFRGLKCLGLDALEVEYPWGRHSKGLKLRGIAEHFGFGITGGSDCHGPQPANRRIGSHGITLEELANLRSLTS